MFAIIQMGKAKLLFAYSVVISKYGFTPKKLLLVEAMGLDAITFNFDNS
jgi:hypothetical protein